MDFSERLARAMSLAGYTQGRLAKEVGMAQSSVNKLLNGANGSRKIKPMPGPSARNMTPITSIWPPCMLRPAT